MGKKSQKKITETQALIASQALASLMTNYPQLQEQAKATEVAKALVAGMRVIAKASCSKR